MKRFAIVAAVISMTVGTLLAQQKMEMPKPGPEHQKLAAFVGNWTLREDEIDRHEP